MLGAAAAPCASRHRTARGSRIERRAPPPAGVRRRGGGLQAGAIGIVAARFAPSGTRCGHAEVASASICRAEGPSSGRSAGEPTTQDDPVPAEGVGPGRRLDELDRVDRPVLARQDCSASGRTLATPSAVAGAPPGRAAARSLDDREPRRCRTSRRSPPSRPAIVTVAEQQALELERVERVVDAALSSTSSRTMTGEVRAGSDSDDAALGRADRDEAVGRSLRRSQQAARTELLSAPVSLAQHGGTRRPRCPARQRRRSKAASAARATVLR